MTIKQKRAIGYHIRQKEEENRTYFLIWKDLLEDFENSKYKLKIWYIRNKGIYQEYVSACHYYNNNLKNLPRKKNI